MMILRSGSGNWRSHDLHAIRRCADGLSTKTRPVVICSPNQVEGNRSARTGGALPMPRNCGER